MASRNNPGLSELYAQFVEGVPAGLAVIHSRNSGNSSGWELIACNLVATHAAGNSISDYLELTLSGRNSPFLRQGIVGELRRVMARQRPISLGQLRRADGLRLSEVYSVKAFPLPGKCVGILLEDVTAWNQSLNELAKINSLLERLSASAGAILWVANPTTLEFSYVSPGARQILGYWVERWCHERNFWQNHLHPLDWEAVRDRCARTAFSGEETQFDCRMYSAHGELRWFRVYVRSSERVRHRQELYGVMIDITERKRVEQAATRLSADIMRAQERERKHVSRELHDSVGQQLTAIKCALDSLKCRRGASVSLRRKLKDCARIAQDCMAEVRSVSSLLHPPELEYFGLVSALRSYGGSFSERSKIRLKMELPESDERLGNDLEIALFRIAQEGLTNIQRHARTKSACLRLGFQPERVMLEIEDLGVGFDPGLLARWKRGAAPSGIGLLKMRERIRELNGELEIHSNGRGALVRVQIPRKSHQPVSEPWNRPSTLRRSRQQREVSKHR